MLGVILLGLLAPQPAVLCLDFTDDQFMVVAVHENGVSKTIFETAAFDSEDIMMAFAGMAISPERQRLLVVRTQADMTSNFIDAVVVSLETERLGAVLDRFKLPPRTEGIESFSWLDEEVPIALPQALSARRSFEGIYLRDATLFAASQTNLPAHLRSYLSRLQEISSQSQRNVWQFVTPEIAGPGPPYFIGENLVASMDRRWPDWYALFGPHEITARRSATELSWKAPADFGDVLDVRLIDYPRVLFVESRDQVGERRMRRFQVPRASVWILNLETGAMKRVGNGFQALDL